MVFLLQILCSSWCVGKCHYISLRNCFLMFVFTWALYGALNHVMFLVLLFCCVGSSGVCFFAGWYCSLVQWPDLCNAFSYSGLFLSNMSLLLEIVDRQDSMDLGICFVIVGGWFDSVCTYEVCFQAWDTVGVPSFLSQMWRPGSPLWLYGLWLLFYIVKYLKTFSLVD